MTKVAIIGARAIARHHITKALQEMAIEVTEEVPIISDLTIALKDHPEILNDIPGQDWRGKGKRKMRRQR